MSARSRRALGSLLLALTIPHASHAANAASAPAARRVVEAYLEATGGRAAFEAESTLHVRGTVVAQGLTGVFECRSMAPDRTWTAVRLGDLRVDTGFDGTTAWRLEAGARKVTVLEGADLEAARAEAWFQNERWARADQGGGTVVLGAQAFGDAGIEQALEITSPGGERRRLWFSRKTGHLLRVVSRRGRAEWVERFTDFRRSAGRVRAHASESGHAKVAASYHRIEVDSVWTDPLADSVAFSPPREPVSVIGEGRREPRRRPRGVTPD